MALAALAVVPSSPQDWASYSFLHMVSHRDILRFIAAKKSMTLNEYVIDPMPLQASMEEWNNLHYQMHVDMDKVLNIQGSNLQDVDWKDADSVGWFVARNFDEHYAASTILGIE